MRAQNIRTIRRWLLAALAALALACSGKGNLSLTADKITEPPVDTAADVPRPESEYLYSELTDVSADIPRTADNFNFKTVVDTEIALQLRFYDDLKPVEISGNAVVLLRDASGRLLWAGVTDAAGALTGSTTLPAAIGATTIYIYKDRFGERSITVNEIGKIKKLARSLYVQKTAATSATLTGQPTAIAVGSKTSASPNLIGSNLSLIDGDADSVPDAFDDFPLDASRAFAIKIPAEQYFTISFEDLFPVVGDGDYNDFTGRYGIVHVLNAQNQLVEITGNADAIARLAGYRHRFGLVIRFPGYAATLDTHKSGSTCNATASSSQTVSNLANVNFFESTNLAFTNGVGHHTAFTLHFNSPIPQSAVDLPPYDPYVYVHNTGKDVHLIGKPALPGSLNPAVPVGFRDSNGFPWAMLVPNNYKYPKEGMFIENAYPQFALWRQSLGQTNQDWYNYPVAGKVVAQPATTTCLAALQVQSTIPANNDGLLPVNSIIRIFFNQSINPQTVNYQTVSVLAGASPITGNLSVSANEITFVPTYDLTPGFTYSIRVTPLLKSVIGDTLQGDFLSTFSTEIVASASEVRELDIYAEGNGPVFLASGTDLYFGASQQNFGTELWKSDGSYFGTLQVRDLAGGDSSALPQNLTAFGGRLLFNATHPVYGSELFSSDGTLFGTDLVRDINAIYSGAVTESANPSTLTVWNNKLFFVADDGVHGKELWSYDGTVASIVADLNLLVSGSATGSSNPTDFTPLGQQLVFVADDGVHGRELFSSDGTAAGTALLKDLRAGLASATPQYLTASAGKVYFAAYDAISGNELFETDGTTAGTKLTSDIYAGGSSSFPSRLIDLQGRLFFTATGEGTGTELYCLVNGNPTLTKDITLGNLSTYFGEMFAYGPVLLFVRTGLADGDELWRSDCTDAGTFMIRKLNPGNFRYLTAFAGRVYFSADDGLNGQELWKTDGTFTGTLLVRNIKPGSSSSNPSNLTASGNRLYFRIYDPFSAFPEALWKYEP